MGSRLYLGGYQLEDVSVEFAKFEPHSNTDKFFRIEVTKDLFCDFALRITKGRRSGRSQVVVRGHSNEQDMLKDLTRLCARRFEHGYTLKKALLRDDLVPLFDVWMGEAAEASVPVNLDLALFQCLSLLRSRLEGSEEFEGLDEAFDKTIFSVDPQNRGFPRGQKRPSKEQLCLPEFPASDTQTLADPRRRVIRFLVAHLLRDDPLVVHSIFRALQVPGRFLGDNIVNLASVKQSRRTPSHLRLVTLIEQEPDLATIGDRLFFAGIKTVAELIALSEADLRVEFEATDRDVRLIRYALGMYGLRLSADMFSKAKE